ncbi:phage tail protein [Achromobacter xylosoxidans]|uniref:phage tail protein n=1 Tax=Alcaligenes xylosoxydans xylosoxydans TaxID=85698 RepID=UPI0012377F8D|nr:phage tail protein [Achromobacter xylosoxidans]
MAITSLPTPPSRSDPENFPERADAFMAALPRFATEANALQEHVNEAAAAVDQDAAAAAQSRDAAAESKGQANQSAVNAELARQAAAQKAGEAGASALLAQQWATKMGAPVEGDGFSAKHWAEIAAMGAGLPIYMPGSLPPQNVGPIYIAGQGNAEWDVATGRYRVHSDIPVGAVAWWPLRASIPAGRIPADGQTISRATFPDLAAMVVAGTVPVATESDWLADPRNRGCYTAGDGSTTIRVPDLNGRSTGSLGRVFLSGDGTDSNGTWGVIQRDQFQKHHHYINLKTASGGADVYGTAAYGNGTGSQYSTWGDAIQFNPQVGPPRSGDKTHPQNVTGVWTIQAFGAVTNPGAADAAQLATDYAALNAAFQSVQGQLLGVGQGWQNLTASRSLDVTYINTTGRPIIVQVYCISTVAGGYSFFAIDEVPAGLGYYPTTSGTLATYGVVPAGSKYRVSVSGANLNTWREYR